MASLLTDFADLARRVARLERPQREQLMPVVVGAGVPLVETAPKATHVALASGVGGAITWSVLVTVGPAAMAHLRLRDGAGVLGGAVSTDATRLVTVRLPLSTWSAGELRLVYLDCWMSTGSATILPLRAVGA